MVCTRLNARFLAWPRKDELMVKGSRVFSYWCVFLFFIILMLERAQSLFFSLTGQGLSVINSLFDIYAYSMVCISLVVSLILMCTANRYFFAALFSQSEDVHNKVSPLRLSILIGVLLVSGMIHTEYSILWVQFVAYGFLILGMIVTNIENLKHKKSDFTQWISLFYLIAYSMAVPVVYESNIPNALAFHIVEAAGSIVLIGMFSFMLYKVFAGKASNLLYVAPIHIAMFIDIAVIWMRWKEEINYFLIIALGATVILWLLGTFLVPRRK